ncbi:tripartite tricarboxylate transporter TctB family protein [Modestobacter sp. VKM Ac-2985]|uniref:tripartite tricarboxylate transporter TctB family protein n=1 Tax=Modestobacter sp. VKM Ac-2985 TaxID=3004139 RepID=UPI0022AB6ABE|nr:tripartite tricarboxylate transporter TctB family protein [Modestobacter sp. VKM Ac-2985]MCZ2840188.1 tripartite tricarboxylate transporter TctB family protein [Modestobacter sp. VKM Ac-2985]
MTHRFDRYASILFLLIGLGFVLESRKIAASAYGSNVGPDIFPMGLGIVLILLSLRLLFETKGNAMSESKKRQYDYKRFLIILISAIFYGLLIETVGYVITTFVFLTVCFQVMERGGWLKTLLISGGFSCGIYYLYVKVLDGSLPGFPVWIN